MNLVCLTGRLTKDPDYRITSGEMQVCKFVIAVDRVGRSADSDKADFPRITVFGKHAENCNKYLSKGKLVGVQGRLQTGSYENDRGEKVYTTDVIADRVEFLSPRSEGEQASDTYQAIDENVPF